MKLLLLIPVTILGLFAASCGGGSRTNALPVQVSATCGTTTLTVGQTTQCSASVPVSWSASAGTVDAAGKYTAHVSPSTAIVTATHASGATASVSIQVQDLPIVYSQGIYSAGCYRVASIMPDGTAFHFVDNGCTDSDPTQSSDGATVIYAVKRLITPQPNYPDRVADHFTVVQTATGSFSNVSIPLSNAWSVASLALAPDKSHIAFLATSGDPQYPTVSLNVMRWDPSDLRTIYSFLDTSGPFCLSSGDTWTPDSQQLIASLCRYLVRMNADGTGLVSLTPAPPTNVTPAWNPSVSPDGKWIAYDDGSNVRIADAGGTFVREVGAGRYPHWSLDSKRLVFMRQDFSRQVSPIQADLWIYDLDRGTIIQITHDNASYQPFWAR